MKVVILAGGLGTRLSEETDLRPKPMVEIGGKPILWHLMKYYSEFGFDDFIICCGYKGYVIKEYFVNYQLHNSDVTIDFCKNGFEIHEARTENWKVTLVDTGEFSQTGGRLGRVRNYLVGESVFCFTYGDGLSDVNLHDLVEHHQSSGKLATVTSVVPPGRFGRVSVVGPAVTAFDEKPAGDGDLINGGFFVLSTHVLDLIDGDDCVWEAGPLKALVRKGELGAYVHRGFWQPMDTLREKHILNELWSSNKAPWKIW